MGWACGGYRRGEGGVWGLGGETRGKETEPFPQGPAKRRSYAQVLSVNFATCHYFPFDCRPGIGCREWVEVLGGGTNSLPEGQFEARTFASFSSLHLSTTPRTSTEHRCDELPSRGRLVCRIGDGTDVLVWSVICKFGFWFVVSKMTCLGHFIVHTRRRPRGHKSRLKTTFLSLYILVSLIYKFVYGSFCLLYGPLFIV